MRILLFTVFLFCSAWISAAVPDGWMTDYAAALEKAKKENRSLLLLFTGSAWCPACQKLEKDVLPDPAVKALIQKNFIPVYLDFPPPASNQPDHVKQNLLRKFLGNSFSFPATVAVLPGEQILGSHQGAPVKDVYCTILTKLSAPPPALRAVIMDDLEGLQNLLAYNESPEKAGKGGVTPLMRAAQDGNERAVRILLAFKANPDTLDTSGQSAVFYAVKYEKPDTLDLLLNAKADLKIESRLQETPLSCAIRRGDVKTVEKLLQNGVSPETPIGEKKITPIGYAILEEQHAVVKFLLSRKVNLSVQDSNGKSLMHYAVSLGNRALIQQLLLAGAPKDLKDKNGLPPEKFTADPVILGLLGVKK